MHELRITYNNLHLYPAVQEARSQMLQQMFAWQNIIITLSRIQSSRYQVIGHSESLPMLTQLVFVLVTVGRQWVLLAKCQAAD